MCLFPSHNVPPLCLLSLFIPLYVYSALFSQLMETAEPWFSSYEREVRKVSLM